MVFHHSLSSYSRSIAEQMVVKMFVKVLIIASLCVTVTLQFTPFSACNEGPSPTELRVEGCTKSPCHLVRGTDVVAEWDFIVVADTEDLRPFVRVTALGGTVNETLPEQNACNSLTNGECPLDQDEYVTYALRMPVYTYYPPIPLHLKFLLLDSKENIHVCFEIDAKVID